MKPQLLNDKELSQVPKSKLDIAKERLEILDKYELFISQCPKNKKTIFTKEFINQYIQHCKEGDQRLSITTIYNWQKAFREKGVLGLLPNWGNTKGQRRSINKEAIEYFESIYYTIDKRTIADCYKQFVTVAKEKSWHIPSLRTLQRIIKENKSATLKYSSIYEQCIECLKFRTDI